MNNSLGRVLPQEAVLHGVWKDESGADYHTCTCTSTHPKSSGMGHLRPALGPCPSPPLLPKSGLWVLPFQDGHKTMLWLFLITKGNFIHSGNSVSDQFSPFCSWAFLPSLLDCVTAEHLQFEFPLPHENEQQRKWYASAITAVELAQQNVVLNVWQL